MRSGFKVELMAAEPLVLDPVEIAWGPDGKAWVVEMADYPLGLDGKGKPSGRVRCLEDTDGDGVYDKSAVFLDGLNFPNGCLPWRTGVLVTCAPEVFYAEDTDGDGKADVRRPLYTGFGEGNQQHRVNHPRWGLDNWIYLANGDGGAGANGIIRSVLQPDAPLDIRGRDIRIRPDDGSLDVVAGQAQFGRNRNDWGDWFGCDNNRPGWYYAVEDRYIRRNPHVAAPPGRVDLTAERTSYPCGWVVTHHGLGEPCPPLGQPGSWTCLCGVMIYRDELLGREFTGNAFFADAVYNCVSRKVVSPAGVLFRGERTADEQQSEFLGSYDPWFRPTTIQTGPDGALWVVDMYRFVIEHPQWINDDLEKTLDLRLGHDKGRIWRVYPANQKPRPIPRLDKLDAAGLVAALDSPNGWQRDMAQMLLLWRNGRPAAVGTPSRPRAAVSPGKATTDGTASDAAAKRNFAEVGSQAGAWEPGEKAQVVKLLETMAAESTRPLARLHAVCTLDGLGALRTETIQRGLADTEPGVRRQAVRLSEPRLAAEPALGEALLKLADDPDLPVRQQVAYSLGEWPDARAGRALGRLARQHADDPYLLAAVLSSAMPHVESMLAEVVAEPSKTAARAQLTSRLLRLAAEIKASPDLLAGLAARRGESVVRVLEESLRGTRPAEEIAQALARFEPALTLPGDPAVGKQLFLSTTCAVCHRLGDVGTEIGPDLTTLVDRSPQYLRVAVIDPNRAFKEKFMEYTAITAAGKIVSGMLLEETSNSLTLVDGEGRHSVILRKDLEELIARGRSHMPERLESNLAPQKMADLFAFIRSLGPQTPGTVVHAPAPVRAERDGSLRLLARHAEIRAGKVHFDGQQDCLVWHAGPADDHVAWTAEVPQAGRYAAHIQWTQIPDYADNPFVIEAGPNRLTAKFPSTGGWGRWQRQSFGQLDLPAGRQRVILRPGGPIRGELSDLREIHLVPVTETK
jgi:putative membrane-bound dehydrogenase-like protein